MRWAGSRRVLNWEGLKVSALGSGTPGVMVTVLHGVRAPLELGHMATLGRRAGPKGTRGRTAQWRLLETQLRPGPGWQKGQAGGTDI